MTPDSRSRRPLSMRAAAETVVRRLKTSGHTALFAGGCVRDMVMGKRPHDYDVATSAKPDEVIGLFRRTQKIGAKFGVVLVRVGKHAVEVATFRRDMEYRDGRHPTDVQFTDAREDALRRDFTINGMFYDPATREVVDYVGGQDDIRARVIRAIGEPTRRFAEDHLRLLRAIRFAARLDFKIDAATWAAMQDCPQAIATISPERIREELDAILSHSSRARAFADLHASGLLGHLWPGASEVQPAAPVVQSLLAALEASASFELALAAVFHPLAPLRVEAVCEALRCSNQTRKAVTWLVENQNLLDQWSDLTLAQLKRLMVAPAFDELLQLHAAQLRARGKPPASHRQLLTRLRAIRPQDVAPPPLLTGHHLSKLGLAPGPVYKAILDRVYDAQLNGDIADLAAARVLARRLIDEGDK